MFKSVSLKLALIGITLIAMGCPNNRNTDNAIAPLGSYGDFSQVTFVGTRLDSAERERINMPYAVGQLYRSNNNQLLMSLYFFEYGLASGGDPCFNLNLINQQNLQRSFTVHNLDYASRASQTVSGNYYGTGVYNYVPSVIFQAIDKGRSVSLLETSFNGSITVLESSVEGVYIQFNQVASTQNCYRTGQNQNLACGASVTGRVRVRFCGI